MPRRQSQTNLEAWIDLASRLPWWAGILFAAVSYVGLHAVAQTPVASPSDLTGMSGALTWPTIRTIAGIGQYLLPVILLIGAALSAIEGHRKRRLLAESRQKAGTADLLDLTWQDFELLVGQTFRERGFRVTETESGPDGGVDLELRKARRGSNRGRNFWGCSRFPDCRGTRPLAGPSD